MKISPKGLNEENSIQANGSAMPMAQTRRTACSSSL
jgi:hypothetical protein